jgi:choline dehydrogenase-like flavoprotein
VEGLTAVGERKTIFVTRENRSECEKVQMSKRNADPTGFDYVIVGAGSAGCVIAARLSENPEATVLLLEAGGDGLQEVVHNPQLWPTLEGTDRDWGYRTVPMRGNGHAVAVPRGRGFGGSHAINAMAFLRGHPTDFDSWAYAGNPGWAYEQVLPYFKRVEDVPRGDPKYRGRGGPLRVGPTAQPHPLTLAFVEACRQAGHSLRLDFNCAELDGTGLHDMTIADGARQTTADAYLRPVLSRPNLTLALGARVQRIQLKRNRCTGVDYVLDGRLQRVSAGEVVLCAGAIGSPQLLLLSGIGDPQHLGAVDIPVVAPLPGVGRNLHDHILLRGICVEAPRPIPAGTGNLGEAVVYWRSDDGLPGPDLQVVLVYAPFHNPWQETSANAYTFAVAHMRPTSRGRLSLASDDPQSPPLIDFDYLGQRHDVETLLQGVEKALELRMQPAFASWRGKDVMSGIEHGDRAARLRFVRDAASTFSHAVGTCRMGVDDHAVVTPQLRVQGLDGLRVADASIMPSITSTNTNAATIMIGEKAADLIRGRELSWDKAAVAPLGRAGART